MKKIFFFKSVEQRKDVEQMKVINCFTLTTSNEDVTLTPGIPCEIFPNPFHPTICQGYTPFCNYAVENDFKRIDYSNSYFWLVDTQSTVVNSIFFTKGIRFLKNKSRYHYYRYFNDLSERQENIYLLIKCDKPIPCSFPDCEVISTRKKEVLLKLSRGDIFTFMDKKVHIGPLDLKFI